MGEVVLGLPAVDERGHNSVPVAGASRISGQSRTDAILPLFGRHGREVPGHRSLARSGHLSVKQDERVGRGILAGEGGERSNEVHFLRHGSTALVRGDDPLEERDGRVDVFLISDGVHAPVVLGAGAQALILFTLSVDVDRQHGDVLIAQRGDGAVLPSAVLEEHSLLSQELVAGVVAGLGGQQSRLAGGVVDVQIPDVLVFVL